ncbi:MULTISPECIES: tetratricopeptide repeat protein [Thalassospira]|uniref:HemY N-terminal domain-containing protein n=1 Tax=Thalassospira aquimaris TaxID=3037796 RepID=A0ABT6GC91_9PROT|nr:MULTISPECIES: hypothetical protein [Thalassospira]MDG4719705.1 hypothetical protein [Thalassospira sp. FZY0004]
MVKKAIKFLLSDTWIAGFSRLIPIVFGFLAFYSWDDFRTWFDENVGATLLAKVVFIGLLFVSAQWVFVLRRAHLELEPERDQLRSNLSQVQSELTELRNGMVPVSPEASFIEGISLYISSLSEKGRDRHVLRLRDTLSRHLWVEGLLRARIAVGDAAANAAARLGDDHKQIAALIDDLGWTLVAMEKRTLAKEKIELGLKIAERVGSPYWVSKAHRHLAGIATIDRRFKEVYEALQKSELAADEIDDDKQKAEMLGGIKYATAVALLFEGKYEEALKFAQESADIRDQNGDVTRSVRSYALRGKILLRIGDSTSRGEAEAVFHRGLREAQSVGRRDEIIRNLNGLAKIAELKEDPEAAVAYKAQANEMIQETPVPYELLDKL